MPLRYLTGFLASLEKKLSLYHGGFQLDTFLSEVLDLKINCHIKRGTSTIVYDKVACSSLSGLVAHFWVLRLFMKGKFDA